jgi:DUF4097 and DUF4098 domain-containing protein YvlB
MTTYPTPHPISATIDLAAGDIEVRASDRDDTIVEVAPSYALNDADVAAVEQTRVEFANGVLRVIGAKGRGMGLRHNRGSVRVTVSMPTGSSVQATSGIGRITGSGRFGDCRVRSGAGDVAIADASSLDVATGIGEVTANEITGDVKVKTGTGAVRVTSVGGATHIRNSNGITELGDAQGTVSVKSSNGRVTIDRAHSDVKAATSLGDVTLGSVEGGSVEVRTAMGRVEVGVREGVAARLDLHTSFGNVISGLAPTGQPAATDGTVTVVARTSAGDIVISRAAENIPAP